MTNNILFGKNYLENGKTIELYFQIHNNDKKKPVIIIVKNENESIEQFLENDKYIYVTFNVLEKNLYKVPKKWNINKETNIYFGNLTNINLLLIHLSKNHKKYNLDLKNVYMFGNNFSSDLVLAKSFIPNEYFLNSKKISSPLLKIKAFICIKGSDKIIKLYEKLELDDLYSDLNNYKNLMYLNVNNKMFNLYKKNNVDSRISFFNLKKL